MLLVKYSEAKTLTSKTKINNVAILNIKRVTLNEC